MLTQIPTGLDEIIYTFGSLDTPDFEAHYIEAFTSRKDPMHFPLCRGY